MSASIEAQPAERTTICIGDVHGFYSKLLRLWSNIQSVVDPTSFETALVIFLGDYNDRGPETRSVLDFLIQLPRKYPRQRHVFLCGNHDLAFAAFVGALPAPPDRSARFSDTWAEFAQSEDREGWYKGEGYTEMHVQGRRWAGDIGDRFNPKKGIYHKGSIYDSRPTFESYGVPHGSSDLMKAVPEEHKKFLHDLVWVHEEEDVAIDTDEGRKICKLIAVHAGLENTNVEERLQVLRARDTSLPTLQELRGRKNVWDIPKELREKEKPIMVVSGHHGKLYIEGLRFIIDESGGMEDLPMAAIIFPSKQIVRDNDL